MTGCTLWLFLTSDFSGTCFPLSIAQEVVTSHLDCSWNDEIRGGE